MLDSTEKIYAQVELDIVCCKHLIKYCKLALKYNDRSAFTLSALDLADYVNDGRVPFFELVNSTIIQKPLTVGKIKAWLSNP